MEESKIVDDTKFLLLNNEPIEEKLHVIAVSSNPCNYKIRNKLAREFIKRMEQEPDCILYFVELVYGNQEFALTSSDNERHLQLRGKFPLWHKENMINLGVKNLLPKDWKAVAWVDADVEFDSPTWAKDTLKLLSNGRDFLQLFTHCMDMDNDRQIMKLHTSSGYQYRSNFKRGTGLNYWHPGFAWACNRKAFDQIGGLFQEGVVGNGDHIMCESFRKNASNVIKKGISQAHIDFIDEYQDKFDNLKLGYVLGTIKHNFHGQKENRNYYNRQDILIKYQFNPYIDVTVDENGIVIPARTFPFQMQLDIINYFKERNEDELYSET